MKFLLTGSVGQLGHALRQQVPAGVELIASSRGGGDGLLNSGAYTAVDKAESEPELAHAVNGGAPRAFAEALAETGGRLLQVSTDFVFNGAQGRPYRPEQPRDPLGIYGASKVAGEEAVEHVLGPSGRGLQRAKPEISVVADQVGCPTSTHTLAAACWRATALVDTPIELPAVLHWSDAGAACWYDVAVAVGELGLELGLLERMAAVAPITTADYPTPAQRPSYSLLDCSETRRLLELPAAHWRQALRLLLEVVR